LLTTANATADHENYDMALQQCQQMLNQLPKERATTADRVKAYMLTHPPGQLSEDAVAAAMFITKRTLARRLAKEDCSYRQLRDEIFASLAARYVRDSALSVESIAGLLGYHDSANFRRAFKRWFGVTPSQYREK
jgi:AraC-like DNA-binding protein